MKYHHLTIRFVVLFLCVITTVIAANAQTQSGQTQSDQRQSDRDYKTKREQALQLFNQDKRLEALPLLDVLVQRNPNDEDIVIALAASLVSHATTLTDQQAAAAERMRAKGLLEKLGSNYPLAGNLLQLLREMPETDQVQFSNNPQERPLSRGATMTKRSRTIHARWTWSQETTPPLCSLETPFSRRTILPRQKSGIRKPFGSMRTLRQRIATMLKCWPEGEKWRGLAAC
jgi:hypothetical protein